MMLLDTFKKQIKFKDVDSIKVPETLPRQVVDLDRLVKLSKKFKDAPFPFLCKAENILLVGELYLRIVKFAGLEQIPCLLVEDLSFEHFMILLKEYGEADLLSLVEFIVLMDFMHEKYGLSHGELGEIFGISRVAVTNRLRLLKLPFEVLYSLVNGEISEGHARALLGLRSKDLIQYVYKKVIEKGLSVRQTEELVREVAGRKKRTKSKIEVNIEVDSTLNRVVLTFKEGKALNDFLKRFKRWLVN